MAVFAPNQRDTKKNVVSTQSSAIRALGNLKDHSLTPNVL